MGGADPSLVSLAEVADRLYGLTPDAFTQARTAAERQARAAGDRELAAAVKTLRRPTLSAWALNLLVRRRRDLVAQVVELGQALREAQASLQGDALRDLLRQRRQLVGGVTAEAVTLAAAEGQRLTTAVTRQVEDTLHAAMADPAAGEALLSGVLVQPLSSTGLDSLGEALGVPLAAERTATLRAVPDAPAPEPDARAREQADLRLAEAEAALREATAAHEKASRKRAKAEARLLQLEAELDELRRRVAAVEQASEEAAARLARLDRKAASAASALAAAEEKAREAADAVASQPPG